MEDSVPRTEPTGEWSGAARAYRTSEVGSSPTATGSFTGLEPTEEDPCAREAKSPPPETVADNVAEATPDDAEATHPHAHIACRSLR